MANQGNSVFDMA